MKKFIILNLLIFLAISSHSQTTSMCSGSCTSLYSSAPSTNNILYISPNVTIAPNSSGIFIVCPSVTTSYTLKPDAISPDQTIWTVLVYPNPVISVYASASVYCLGQVPVQISASGAATYSWNTLANTNSIVVSPITTSTYSVTGVDINGCSGTTSITIPVINIPASAPPITICSGQSGTLSASGGTFYSWSYQSAITHSIVVTPSVTTNYSVIIANQGCAKTISTQVIVATFPSASVNSSIICSGNSATLIANGINTYTWSNGSNASSIMVNPTTNTVYTISGGLTGCAGTSNATASVMVSPNPTISAVGVPSIICQGQSATLTATGATNYSWSSAATTSMIVVSPNYTTNYFVTGTNSVGCSGTSSLMIKVVPVPNLVVSLTPTVCNGQTNTISVSGAYNYTLNTQTVLSATNTVLFVVTPTTAGNTIYNITGMNGSGCSTSTQAKQYVSACLGINGLQNQIEVTLFPNPAKETIHIDFPLSEKIKVQIVHISGALVLEEQLDSAKQTINITDLKAGIYFVSIQNNSRTITRKLLVEN